MLFLALSSGGVVWATFSLDQILVDFPFAYFIVALLISPMAEDKTTFTPNFHNPSLQNNLVYYSSRLEACRVI